MKVKDLKNEKDVNASEEKKDVKDEKKVSVDKFNKLSAELEQAKKRNI